MTASSAAVTVALVEGLLVNKSVEGTKVGGGSVLGRSVVGVPVVGKRVVGGAALERRVVGGAEMGLWVVGGAELGRGIVRSSGVLAVRPEAATVTRLGTSGD